MRTNHKIIFGNSQQMIEVADRHIQLMVTSPPLPYDCDVGWVVL